MLVVGSVIASIAFAPSARAQDVTPPSTRIADGPAEGASVAAPPVFSFRSTEPTGATFLCSVDGGPEQACAPPHTLGPLPDGPHTFRVRARDRALNVDPAGAARTFVVDTRPPDTVLLTDVGETTDATPAYTFAADEPATFACQVNGGLWEPCAPPYDTPPLRIGAHSFAVRAIDAAGNADPAWPVDLLTVVLPPFPEPPAGLAGASTPAAATRLPVRAVTARCVRRSRGRGCAAVVTFRVSRTATVLVDVLRGTRRVGTLRRRARPPRSRITLPQRIDGRRVGRGRLRIAVRVLDDVGATKTAGRATVRIR